MIDLKTEADKLGVNLTREQLASFDLFYNTLIEWNEKFNLTAITEKDEIYSKHFLDSLTIIPHIPEGTHKIIDIGAGAGFPGLPIKIARPDLNVTLTDSVGKKVVFMNEVINALSLKNTLAISNRAEDLGKSERYREKFEVATARAVAYLPVLCEYVLPLVKVGGIFIAQKSLHDEHHTEISDAKNAIGILGGEVQEVIKVNIPFAGDRHLVIIKKVRETPHEFPRENGLPKLKPL